MTDTFAFILRALRALPYAAMGGVLLYLAAGIAHMAVTTGGVGLFARVFALMLAVLPSYFSYLIFLHSLNILNEEG